MGISSEFETFEKEFIELISEFQSLSSSESRLREVVRIESNRAEAAEAAKQAAERAAEDARARAAAAAAAASHAARALAAAHDDIASLKVKLELAERQRDLLEEKKVELVSQVGTLDKELQQLRPMQAAHAALKSQYIELLERINAATEAARSESSCLENELRRVEKCASAGAEIRERARLAATAHARDRRLAAAELRHATKELHAANVEISRLEYVICELQQRLELTDMRSRAKPGTEPDQESLIEVRSALEAERAGSARLERSLAAALADNAALASTLHSSEDALELPNAPPPVADHSTNICPIDSFLERS